LDNWIAIAIVSFLGAALSGMGLGGGGIFLIYLTVYAGMDQLTAQGINLVFFIPIAIVAIVIHAKNGLVQWKIILPCVALGLIGVYFGAKLAMLLGSDILSRLFGGFLLCLGIREILAKPPKEREQEEQG